ncbi:hypothetical protein ACLFMI_11535 [Pseudonocardia nantongensis]|uniref:hypothetical protein n=1 Tax=Pseudonocardia nantongensis TaxID=1181885 RepID=UPI00397D8141
MRGLTGLTARGWLVASAGLLLVVLVTAWVAGSGSGPPAPTTGSVRLGPEPGQDVAGYLATLPATLPPPGATAPALVQLDVPRDTAGAAALAGQATVGTVVFRVPIDRVQTALRFEPVTGTGEVRAALDVARERAAFAAEADAARAADSAATAPPQAREALERRAAVTAAERRRLADPGCACVVALVVTADRAGLDGLASRDGVRAVQAAAPGTRPRDLALSPLLPEQTGTVTPPPDDGPVPG